MNLFTFWRHSIASVPLCPGLNVEGQGNTCGNPRGGLSTAVTGANRNIANCIIYTKLALEFTVILPQVQKVKKEKNVILDFYE